MVPSSASPYGLPRTRGDRPLIPVDAMAAAAAPPHPRGSTRRFEALGRHLDGSPAPAGIDPWKQLGFGIS